VATFGAGTLTWLFALQDSSLFLAMWRAIGPHAARIARDERRRVALEEAAAAAAHELSRVSAVHAEYRLAAQVAAQAHAAAGDDEDEQVFGFHDLPLARGVDAPDGVAAAAAAFDDEHASSSGAAAVISQSVVISTLIPCVQRQWRALLNGVSARTLPIATAAGAGAGGGGDEALALRSTFGQLSSNQECLKELLLLVRTGEGGVISTDAISLTGDTFSWLREVAQQLSDFMLMEKIGKWLPGLLRTRVILAALFAAPVDADEHYARIQQLLDNVERLWANQTLGSLSRLVEPVKAEVKDISHEKLDFLYVFSQCGPKASAPDAPDLIGWLLEHKDTQEFGKLLQGMANQNADFDARAIAMVGMVSEHGSRANGD
jgi:hypothetical protein